MNETMNGSAETAGDPTGAQTEGPARRQDFDVVGTLEVDLAIGAGRVTVMLVDEPGASVWVQHDPTEENGWMQGLSSMLNWFNGQFGQPGNTGSEDLPTAAVRETRIELTGQRLVVHGPKRQLRTVPLAVTVRLPAGSHLAVRSGSANVTVTGPAGRVVVNTGSGDVALDRADAFAEVTTGSGALRLGSMLGGLRVRGGTGKIEVSSVGGATTLATGSGNVWLGTVRNDVMVRTGSGDLTVADAASGTVKLTTGSGEIRVGVRGGTAAMVDLATGSGQARSELDLADTPPASSPLLKVRGRTGSGNAVVTAAVS